MEKTLIYALHGFLGHASDWNQVADAASEFEFFCGEMFSTADFVIPQFPSERKKVFLGYSLGGRLGLRLLQQSPESFDHFVFLSTNPGFLESAEADRLKRVADDAAWAEKISERNWDSFFTEWNAQPVFKIGATEPVRSGSEFDLHKLRLSLTENSLGLQPDYRQLISRHKNRISWVVGRDDQKYRELARTLDLEPVIVDSGHRILLENPVSVAEVLSKI